MKNYLPRFTLRRALMAIALLALFLGWLRPDRAKVDQHRTIGGGESWRIEFHPFLFPATISIWRQDDDSFGVAWFLMVQTTTTPRSQRQSRPTPARTTKSSLAPAKP
jgi:hypothetical protein